MTKMLCPVHGEVELLACGTCLMDAKGELTKAKNELSLATETLERLYVGLVGSRNERTLTQMVSAIEILIQNKQCGIIARDQQISTLKEELKQQAEELRATKRENGVQLRENLRDLLLRLGHKEPGPGDDRLYNELVILVRPSREQSIAQQVNESHNRLIRAAGIVAEVELLLKRLKENLRQ